MTPDAWFTAIVLVCSVVAFIIERIPAAAVTLVAVTVLHVGGVVDFEGAFGGLANPAPITIAALYVLAAGVEATGALTGFTDRLLGRADRGSESMRLARICVPSAAASAFIANTPLVAMLAPRVDAWCRRTGRPVSRFLMPLSYATVLGGVVTVLGTSTNLTVNGLMADAGMQPFDVFEFSGVGLAVAGAGVAVLVVLTPRLLPNRGGPTDRISAFREFTVEMLVNRGGPLDGVAVEEAGLRHLTGVFLAEIERRGTCVAPVAPDHRLQAGDRLVFVGDVTRVVDLQTVDGLLPAAAPHFGAGNQRYYEAVVGSGLAGANLRDADFRNRFGAAVLAIHRAGERLPGKLGDVTLRLGDVLVLVAGPGFARRWRDREGFALVSPFDGSVPVRREKAGIVRWLLIGLVVASATELVGLPQAALIAALAVVASGVLTVGEAREAVDVNTVLLVALSFGLGEAVDASGLDEVVASGLISAFGGYGDLGVLVGVLLATMIATELLSNNAAAILVFPVAQTAAATTVVNMRALAVAILIGASCSFLTPIGYQTNTMVYGMGGYRFSDFARVGAPLTVVAAIATALTVPVFFPLR